jgi:hypothetical protein
LALLDVPSGRGQRHSGSLQRSSGFVIFDVQQAKQQMLGADAVMGQQPGLVLRQHEDLAAAISETLQHETSQRYRLR